MIFAIKNFEIHDGDGIRTTVFFKGCPLRCKWCHNPESFIKKPELLFWEHKCTNCGACVKTCNLHFFENSKHKFNRENCTACGNCEKVCPTSALKIYGYEPSIKELVNELLQDYSFFKNSGGGVTLSGGEPLMHADYCYNLLKELKKHGVNTAIDTCGFVDKKAIDKVLPYTDTFLYDVKAIDEAVHIKCCGVSNKLILENLKYLDKKAKNIEIRIPYVPTLNDTEIEKIAIFIKNLKTISKVRVLKYHNLAIDKYNALGLDYSLKTLITPSDESINNAIELLKSYGLNAMGSDDE